MRLTGKARVTFEVNEMGDKVAWVYIQSVISLQCFSLVSLALLWRVMAMPIFQNKKYNIAISSSLNSDPSEQFNDASTL